MVLSLTTLFIGLLILLALMLVVGIALMRLEAKIKRLCRGAKGADLEESINALHQTVADLKKFEGESKGYFKNVERRLRRSSQSIETVRFNAFKDGGTGGFQSFATAILNEDGDGAVVSSLYSRDRVSVFSKPIKKFASEIELSEEEKEALSRAQAKLSA